jgi:hypothetical protein
MRDGVYERRKRVLINHKQIIPSEDYPCGPIPTLVVHSSNAFNEVKIRILPPPAKAALKAVPSRATGDRQKYPLVAKPTIVDSSGKLNIAICHRSLFFHKIKDPLNVALMHTWIYGNSSSSEKGRKQPQKQQQKQQQQHKDSKQPSHKHHYPDYSPIFRNEMGQGWVMILSSYFAQLRAQCVTNATRYSNCSDLTAALCDDELC